jgi:hypothetical protein
MKKRKSKFFIIVPLLFLALIILILAFYTKSSQVLEKRELGASLSVGNRTGFNVTEQLSFGMLAPGNAASRDDIILTNDYDFPIKVEFSVEGNIEPFLIYEKVIYLNPGESKEVGVSTITISDEPQGFYSGKMIVVFKKAV